MGAGRERIGRSLEAALVLLLGLGCLGALGELVETAGILAGGAAVARAIWCFLAALALGVALAGWLPRVTSGHLGRLLLAGLSWLLVLLAALAPALLVSLGSAPTESAPWLAMACLIGLASGAGIGRAELGEAATWGCFGLGGALGLLLPELCLERLPELTFTHTGLLAACSVLGALGLTGLALRDLLGRAEAHENTHSELAPLRPRLAGLFTLAVAVLGTSVLGWWSTWCQLAPSAPVPGSLGLTIAGCLGLGALLLGGSLRASGLAGLSLLLGLGLGWLMWGSGPSPALPSPLLLGPPSPEVATSFAAAVLFHLRFVGPLLLVLGAAPVVLTAEVQASGRGRRRGQLAAWLVPLGLLAYPPVGAVFVGAPFAVLLATTGLLLVLLFLAGDLVSPGVGIARGPVERSLPVLLRGLALVALAATLPPGSRVTPAGPLSTWYRPADVLAVELEAGTLELVDPTTGLVRERDRSGWSLSEDETQRLFVLGSELAAGLELPPGGGRLVGPRGPGVDLGQDPSRAEPPVASLTFVPAIGDEGAFARERLAALAADLAPEGVLVAHLSTERSVAGFQDALAGFATVLPSATAWFVDDEVFLVGAREVPRPKLDELESGLARVAAFVAVLPAAADGRPGGRGQLELGPHRPAVRSEGERWRRRARNLEQLFGRATAPPGEWGPLLGGVEGPLTAAPALQAGRFLRQAHLAHAWVNHHATAAPGSLAMETWSTRLDDALQRSLLELPGLAAAGELFELAEAEAGARRGFELLDEGEPIAAIPYLVRSTQRWPERGDLALGLATALELVGNRSAARVVLRDLGATRASLLETEVGRHLLGLGLDPELVLATSDFSTRD